MGEINLIHKTHKETVLKFVLLLAVFIGYFAYLNFEYGLATGGLIAGLTWSFFVLCTPIADAGFLLDFPIRLILGVRMIVMEVVVWLIALALNLYGIFYSPEVYENTFLTNLLYKILTNPYPYWGIVFLCGLGTFFSIYFGDEMIDVLKHKNREKFHKHGFKLYIVAVVSFFGLIILAYYHLLETLNIHLS